MEMTSKQIWRFWLAAEVFLAVFAVPDAPADSEYVYRDASRDGIGKFYMGREIAQVMGHRGADWLERPDRENEEAPNFLVSELGLSPTDVVADIGAGTGYFTFRMSPLVPEGTVFAVDIQEEMLGIIKEKMTRGNVENVIPIMGEIDDPHLPGSSVDLALLVDAKIHRASPVGAKVNEYEKH